LGPSDKMKPKKPIETLILGIRNQKVILDADLAELYGVPTKVFNQAIKRNRERFPDDFAFQLTTAEFAGLRSLMTAANSSQIATSSSQAVERESSAPNWSQFVTSSQKHRGAAYRPWAYVACRVRLKTFYAAILKRLAEIDKTLLEHDSALRVIWTRLQPLLAPPPEPPRRRIGFNADNK
jgi:hypothetical protein